MNLYDVPAPAKLNLFLHIVGRRGDGYHLLQTVFRFIGLADSLHFESRADGDIVRVDPLPGVPADTDLTVRAARALQAATGTRQGVSIGLEKRIPMGGGLGGGSSDAASTLIALNRLWNTGLSRAALMRLALPLGADVPVFVFGQSAFAEGVGEILTAVPLPERAYLVAQPDASVPTPAVYGDPDLTRDTPCIKIADFLASTYFSRAGQMQSGQPPGHPPGIRQLPLYGRNDMEPVVYRRFPEVFRAAQWLASPGLEVVARMSGSGACLFAEFPDMQAAILAEQEIAATMRVAGKMADTSQAVQEPPVRFRLVQASPGLIEHPLRHWIAS
ncbi:4-(cytidine 5'-diphospho)-2-C-methyl-D-erythritol kinase [Bordetella genomosp. 11]|uniref:4-diphosphocytidyl-2-C-methyl-D-erythritol kinase n=1 Tax=Bordetella genomosp. 11 TaxID=1416808 RepID=A0A261UYH5_9BORD|nr:4-(cytidine 5'-diphospho)-2-C-methyl-D-erythritol kinase [Bordetella genomosp. 11]OZI66627.1 4-(cytidine 5'-diphospho)-2-C-methyl-D-erythritol kinase [Bordetella genomosp. 11]